eukprot:CAMPEP_0174743876 /NCGR_PEP_ID=MMETSP1094-20130205/82776_1 /TAXON_ID=156173 /ORGANISM="Chrysochromulina brevifilum, Strain UTEX LB 985" /LENGTH=41 /DNA_ID= /DNA_START= /DNA_END= /DNA_ORIENTATION=
MAQISQYADADGVREHDADFGCFLAPLHVHMCSSFSVRQER